MRKSLVLLVLLFLFLGTANAYAWTGSGSVNQSYYPSPRQFWVTQASIYDWQNYLIEYTMNEKNAFVYGGGLQMSYNFDIGGGLKKQTEMDQIMGGNIYLYENGSRIHLYPYYHGPSSRLVPSGWAPWGWVDYSTQVYNYYPGGPDWVEANSSWGAYGWWGIVYPNYDSVPIKYYYR